MAKDNNLSDYLLDIADAIREKTGKSAVINAQDFSSEIMNIQTDRAEALANDVNFYDYDGFLLYSYSWEEALNLTELPETPKHKGLICQGWNYTLEEIKSQNGKCNIGANYTTDDGKTRLYINIPTLLKAETTLHFTQQSSAVTTINWGDGSEEEVVTAAEVSISHTYEKTGDYLITLDVAVGKITLGNSKLSNCSVLGANAVDCAKLVAVEIGNNATAGTRGFYYCRNLETISIPITAPCTNAYTFDNTSVLRAVIYPRGLTSISGYALQYSGVQVISIPASVTDLWAATFRSLNNLKSLVFPAVMTTFHGAYVCASATALTTLDFPDGITTIQGNSFTGCTLLTEVIMPRNIQEIRERAFYNCGNVLIYDFTKSTVVPTLANIDVFYKISANCKMLVPAQLYEEWVAATNWSNFADYIYPIE